MGNKAGNLVTSFALIVLATIFWIIPLLAQQPRFRNAPASASAEKNPYAGKAAAAAAGKKLYARYCSPCHGDHLQGIGPAPALDTPQVRNANSGELFWFISTGDVSSGMPSWGNLPKSQRWELVSFLQSNSGGKSAAK